MNASSGNSSSQPPAINFATDWLDELGCVCPKNVDYATQCPKGHALAPFDVSGEPPAKQPSDREIICRACHGSAQRQLVCGWLTCSVAGCCAGYAVCAACVIALGCAPKSAAASTDNFCMMGVSWQYLRWLKAEFGGAWHSRMTTSQFEKMYLRPRTSRLRCSVVDALAADAAAAHHVGPATWFISHTWNNAFADTLDAILMFFEGRADAENAMLWFDVFVDSQHAADGPAKSPQWYMSTFKSSIARIGRLLLVVDAWDNPTALKRAWCVLELHAIAVKKEGGGGDFAVAMTARENGRFLEGVSQDFGAYYNMLGSVDVERSDCSRAADRESIHAGIRDSVGFGELGRMVFGVMEEWMVGQVRALAAAKGEEGNEPEEMRWSCVLGDVLGQQGRHEEAVQCKEKALAMCRRLLSEDNEEQGVYMNNLANSYSALGRHEDALAMQESVLEFRRRVLPPNHPRIGNSMNNLATTYSAIGRHEDALTMQESALEFDRRVLPPNHPNIGISMNNLAEMQSALGRHEDALAMKESVLEFRRQVLPPNHPDIGDSMNNIANSYSALGRHEDALAMQQSVLQFRRRILPPNHPNIGSSMNNLALTYRDLGRHEDALAMQESVLEFRRRVLPPNHPDIGDSMNNLANSYSSLGLQERALVIHENALEFRRRALPPNHPDIGSSMNSLAVTYRALGRHEDALAMQENALEFRRRALPPNHPDIGSSMNNLANIYRALGRLEDALAMQENALELQRRILPPNHIDIAVSLFNVSLSYARVAGGVPRAYECACEALVIWQAALPPSHPHLQMGQENIRLLKLKLQQQ